MNKHEVPRRRIIETNVKHFKGSVLRTITNTTAKEYILIKWKKGFLHRCISKILFIDTEQLSKIWISLDVFFNDFVDILLCTLKMDFFEDIFQRALWLDFRIANYLKSGYSQEYA